MFSSAKSRSHRADRRGNLVKVGLLVVVVLLARPLLAQAQDPGSNQEPAPPTEQVGATPFRLQGFGDINFVANAPDGSLSGFKNGALDLFASSRLTDHWSALVELVFEGKDNALVTDFERFQFTYEHSDAFRVSVGRMHTPLLRWPITHHHGAYAQTPIDKPIVARWEDEPGLWPSHFVGILAQGRLDAKTAVSYSFGVGNGRGHILDEVQVSADANTHKAVTASVGLSFDRVPGFDVHGSIYVDRMPADSGAVRERDVAVSSAYVRGGIELRGEWSRLGYESVASGIDYNTTGWYVLGSHRLPGRAVALRPYVLVEKLDVADGAPVLEGALDESGWAVGLRLDVNRFVALKADYQSRKIQGTDRHGAVRSQLAVNF